jgi:hypothetical protein
VRVERKRGSEKRVASTAAHDPAHAAMRPTRRISAASFGS